MSNTADIMNTAEGSLLHTYNRYPIVLDHGEGVYLYDTDGKQYLDFASGIAVFALGYSNEPYKEAVKKQIDLLTHTSNLYYNAPAAAAARRLCAATGMDRVFFTNSGTEAIEGAIKLARKFAWNKDQSHDHEIIAMKGSFHGRSMGALSVTGNDHYQDPFRPLIGGVKFAEYNNLDSVKALLSEKTCAIILETLQGEGGIYTADPDFLTGIRKICDEKGILMILDEIQCGMGRTGSMFCYEQYGVTPDVVCVAKALGNGLPVGAFLCKEFAAALVPGDHGSTYGGNPLVCAAANAVLDQFEALHIPENAAKTGEILWNALEDLAAKYPVITAHRGKGLMQGLQFSINPAPIITACQQQGLLLITASNNVIRFVPPLVIHEEHVTEMIEKLEKALDQVL